MRRKKMSKQRSKKNFRRYSGHHPKNRIGTTKRGGIRL